MLKEHINANFIELIGQIWTLHEGKLLVPHCPSCNAALDIPELLRLYPDKRQEIDQLQVVFQQLRSNMAGSGPPGQSSQG